MSFGKGPAGTCFYIALEVYGFLSFIKGYIGGQNPRPIFLCVGALPTVVFF